MTYLQKSPWIVHYNASSCNGCDIEILATLTPRYDIERFGIHFVASPRQVARLIKGVTKKRLSKRPSPEKWSVTEILAHLADLLQA